MVPLDDIHIDEHLNYVERSIAILDKKTEALHNKVVGLVKVLWQHRKGSETREHYLKLFAIADFEDDI